MFTIPLPNLAGNYDHVPQAQVSILPTSIEQVICEQCGVSVPKTQMAGHMTQIHFTKTVDNIVCEECGMLMLKRSYNRHRREYHSDERKFECNVCGKKMKNQFYFKSHMRIHENLREFKCHLCDKAYNTRNTLDIHMYRCHERSKDDSNSTLNCDECEETFTNWYLLKVHKEAHERGGRKRAKKLMKLEQCPYCNLSYKKLREHIRRIHDNVKNYQCSVCSKAFLTRWDCEKHTETHTVLNRKKIGLTASPKALAELTKFPCDICTKGFPTSQRLEMHKYRMHNPARMRAFDPYFCFYCKQRFDDIEGHHDTVHNDMFHMCLICLKRYKARSGAHAHMFKHHADNVCVFCSQKFDSTLALKIHVYQVHSKPEPLDDGCLDCRITKVDNIQEHFESMHQNFRFSCQLCYKRFEKTKPLEIHIKTFHKRFSLEFYPMGWTLEKARELANNLSEDPVKSSKKRVSQIDPKTTLMESDSEPEIVIKILMQCKECNKRFDNKGVFYDHLAAVHGKTRVDKRTDILKCPMCGEIFSSMDQLRSHTDVHNSLTHRCKICGKKFAFASAKRHHVKTVHTSTTRQFKCNICNKGCTWKFELKEHMRDIHDMNLDHDSMSFPCVFCGEILYDEAQRKSHLRQVHENGAKTMRTCQLCDSSFKRYDEFKKHIMSHAQVQICLICGQFFHTLEEFEDHSKIHDEPSNEILYECDLCGYTLSSKELIEKHMETHIKRVDDPFKCDSCDKTFKNLNSLNYHKDVTHKGKKEYKCKFCAKEYFRKQNLEIHERTHTQEKPFKCRICQKGFSSKPVLNSHLQKHPETRKSYECKDCNLTFTDYKQSVVHEEQSHPDRRPFWCSDCKKSFKREHSLNAHMRYLHK